MRKVEEGGEEWRGRERRKSVREKVGGGRAEGGERGEQDGEEER